MIETTTLSAPKGDQPGGELARYLVLALEGGRPTAMPERLRLDTRVAASIAIGRGGERSRAAVADGEVRVLVPDRAMSTRHAALSWSGARWLLRDLGSKNGTFVNGVAVEEVDLRDGDCVRAGTTFFVYREDRGPAPGPREPEPAALATMSPRLSRALAGLRRVAATEVTIMIGGETGTGKELVARAVHELSGRRGAFVPLNCGALADSLIQSELFGHARGAFSGAGEHRPGLVRSSHGGTLFLDEVAELSDAAQVALLRVLQEGEVRPVGSEKAEKVDLRVVTATHVDLGERVETGRFRHDLYSRLAGFTVDLLPLRERREDLGLLVAALLPRIAPGRAEQLSFDARAASTLFAHRWPLNVRELEQALRVAVAVADGDEIRAADLPDSVRNATAAPARAAQDPSHGYEALVALLRTHAGNVSAVARELGTSRSQVRRLLARFDLDAASFRGG